MRHSPARAHYHQAMATSQQPADTDQPRDQHAANAYELMLAKLAQDKRRLHDIQSIERKAEVKAQLLPEYMPWIEGVLASDSGRQDDVLMTVFVWTIDSGDFDLALKIGAYAIGHKLVMPDQYKRDVPCVLAEEIADYALKQDEAGLVAQQPQIALTIALTADCDMPDEVRAKLLKANGYALRCAGSTLNDVALLEKARDTLARALQLHDKVGVKKDIERLDTLIKNSPPAVDAEKSAESEGG